MSQFCHGLIDMDIQYINKILFFFWERGIKESLPLNFTAVPYHGLIVLARKIFQSCPAIFHCRIMRTSIFVITGRVVTGLGISGSSTLLLEHGRP